MPGTAGSSESFPSGNTVGTIAHVDPQLASYQCPKQMLFLYNLNAVRFHLEG